MKEHIHHLLEQTVANLKSAGVLPADLEARVQVDRCKEKAHGDLATNLAMLLAKPARKNPRELAAAIIEHLPASDLIARSRSPAPASSTSSLTRAGWPVRWRPWSPLPTPT